MEFAARIADPLLMERRAEKRIARMRFSPWDTTKSRHRNRERGPSAHETIVSDEGLRNNAERVNHKGK